MKESDAIKRREGVYKRACDDYLLLVNNEINQLYCFTKDTELLWDLVGDSTTVGELFSDLGCSYDLAQEKGWLQFIRELVKLGILINNDDRTINTVRTVKENVEQLAMYELFCATKLRIFNVMIELTTRCNLRCRHCYHDDKNETTISFGKLLKLLDELNEMGVVSITYTGGELFTLPNWYEILKETKQRGFLISVLTNLTALERDSIDMLSQIGVHKIQTSIYGSSPETHDYVTKTKGSYNKVIETITALVNNSQTLIANFVLLKTNYLEAPDVKKQMEKLGCEIYFDYKLFPSRNGIESVFSNYIDGDAFKYLYEKGIVKPPTEVQCYACVNKIRINPNGKVFPCEYLNMPCGDIATESIEDIWKSNTTRNIRTQLKDYLPHVCKLCEYRAKCLRCPALVWNKRPFVNKHHSIMCYQARFSDVLEELK